jgi:hypothetical protein
MLRTNTTTAAAAAAAAALTTNRGNALTGHHGALYGSPEAAAAGAAALQQQQQFKHLKVQLDGDKLTVTAADGSELTGQVATEVGIFMNGMPGAVSVRHVELGECYN